MAMLPIFLVGLVLGAVCTYACMNLQREVPSATRLELLEKEIVILKNDKTMLENCIKKKDTAIEQLKSDIAVLEEKSDINKK